MPFFTPESLYFYVLNLNLILRKKNRTDGKRIAGGWDRKRIADGYQTDTKRMAREQQMEKSFFMMERLFKDNYISFQWHNLLEIISLIDEERFVYFIHAFLFIMERHINHLHNYTESFFPRIPKAQQTDGKRIGKGRQNNKLSILSFYYPFAIRLQSVYYPFAIPSFWHSLWVFTFSDPLSFPLSKILIA